MFSEKLSHTRIYYCEEPTTCQLFSTYPPSCCCCLLSMMSDRRYGYFRCPKCNAHWESSHVYCHGFKAVYEQDCKSCKIGCLPYGVKKMNCSVCSSAACTCTTEDRKKRNIDVIKPHRSDLCHKCRSGRPCIY
ncbi:zygote arrest protein 1-like [Haliotis rufescens]|uniref:zygote arrest protein 1-like n=1 Tax=Haliotis rufescens TaxID=6454 RepID=UPI00201F4E02|nr:zygote arrest protein 1-like [Haliotis rufescens]